MSRPLLYRATAVGTNTAICRITSTNGNNKRGAVMWPSASEWAALYATLSRWQGVR